MSTRFANTILAGKNKSGELKPDADGYYTVVLGVLDAVNTVGEFYSSKNVEALLAPHSSLMDRMKRGILFGEWGHPKAENYPNKTAFMMRIKRFDEDRKAFHIADIWVEDRQTVEGGVEKLILGKIIPSGPYAECLRQALDNPLENVCFSGRYYSDVTISNGRVVRTPYAAGTWDYVTEAGMPKAHIWNSPSLESASVTMSMCEDEVELTDQMFDSLIEREVELDAVSMESGSAMSFAELRRTKPTGDKIYSQWG